MPIQETRFRTQRRRLAVHGAMIFVVALGIGFMFMSVQDTKPPDLPAIGRWRIAHMQALLHGILLIALAAGTRYVDFTGSQLRLLAWAAVIGAWSTVASSTLSASWDVTGRMAGGTIENQIARTLFGTGVVATSLAFLVFALRGGWDAVRVFLIRPKWKNWARTSVAHPRRIVQPASLDELVRAVEDARRDGLRIRAAGGSYSWSPLSATDGVLIDCSALTRCLEISPEGGPGWIRVEAGMTIRDLAAYAFDKGLALESTPVIPHVSVGGALAAGCHGTGIHHEQFTNLVREMEVVGADGGVVRYRRPDPLPANPSAAEREAKTTWDALLVSLGALGIVYSVTLDCVPAFNVLDLDRYTDMRAALDGIRELVEGNEYPEVFWFPYSKQVWVKTWNRTPHPPKGAQWVRTKKAFFQLLHNYAIGPLFLHGTSLLPFLTPPAMWFFSKLVGKGEQVKPIRYAQQYQTHFMKAVAMGYGIPVDERYDNVRRAWYAVVDRLDALRRERIYPQNLVMHLRFVGRGDGLLAPSAGNERTCYIEILTFHNTPYYPEYFAAVERDWIALGGRPHWAKLCFAPETVAGSFRVGAQDRVKEFLSIRAKLDPDEVFVNDWLRAVLGM